ncbi:hypothetical protein Tco_1435148 [Tanacetum coccineum]
MAQFWHTLKEGQEARENVELVKEHLASVEIEKMVEGSKNVINDSLLPRNDESKIPDNRLEPRSDKESPKVEITNDKVVEITNDEKVEITNVVNVNEEEEEITDEVYELKRREKGKIVEESRSTPFPTPIRSPRIHTDLVSSDTKKLQELTLQGRYTYLFEHLKARFLSRKSFDTLADHLQEVMVESLPTMVDTHIKEQVKKQVPEQVRDQVPVYVAEGLILERQKTKEEMERMIAKAILQERRNIQAKISSQIQKAIDNHIPSQVDASLQQQDIAIWLALQMKFESLQVPQTTCKTSVVRPRDQDDPHVDTHPGGENRAKWQKTSEYEAYVSGESSSGQSYASDDDEIPMKQMSQDIIEEVSLTNDEAKLKKMVDEMLRQRYDDIERIPEAPPLSLINQDLLYLKKGSSGPEKIICVKKFNPYARYGVEHWKNPHAKIFYIRKQKEPGKPKKVIYSNSKIIQVIKTYWELGHEHKFITEIVARRANECIVPDYAETRLLWSLSVFIRSSVLWERVHDFQLGFKSYQQKVNLTALTISFPGVEKHKMFSIIYEPVHGIIYKNSKKEKRVMRHSEIHKFCDATLNKVLE